MKNKDVNLEVFKNNQILKKLAEVFNEKMSDSNGEKLIENIKKNPNADYQKEFNEIFNFVKENEFEGELRGSSVKLTGYKVSTPFSEQVVYMNIGKEPHESNQDSLMENNTLSMYLIDSKNSSLYDVRFYTGLQAMEIAKEAYFDLVMDYDRIINPQYYRQDHNLEADLQSDMFYEKEVIDVSELDPNEKGFEKTILSQLEELNNKVKEGGKIELNDSETKFDKGNIELFLEELKLNYYSPDSLAETVKMPEETYIYLWNNLTKLNSVIFEKNNNNFEDDFSGNDFTIKDLWNLIPEKHQEAIIEAMSDKKSIKLKNGIQFYEIKAKNSLFNEEEAKPFYLVLSKSEDEKDMTRIFADKVEAEKYHKTISYDPKELRLPF